MNPELAPFLTERQYQRICRYWNMLETLKAKSERKPNLLPYDEYMDEETIEKHLLHNKRLSEIHTNTLGKVLYFEQEYEAYVHSLGFSLNDGSQDEALFQLLNNGILL